MLVLAVSASASSGAAIYLGVGGAAGVIGAVLDDSNSVIRALAMAVAWLVFASIILLVALGPELID